MKKFFLALALMLLSVPAYAATCNNYPYTLSNGQVADANQVMANFNNVLNCVNQNITNLNYLPLTGGTLTGTLDITAPLGANGEVITQTGANQDLAALDIRRTVNQSGGTYGYVNNALRAYTITSGTSENFEWAETARLDNSSTGSAQDVALYAQTRDLVSNASSSWAGVIDLDDVGAGNNPGVGRTVLEMDYEGQGTDQCCGHGSRKMLYIVPRQNTIGDSSNPLEVYQGIALGSTFASGEAGYVTIDQGLVLNGTYNDPVVIDPDAANDGIVFQGNYTSATGAVIDLHQITGISSHLAMLLSGGQQIGLEGTQNYRSGFNPTCGTYTSIAVWAYTTGGTSCAETAGLEIDSGAAGLRLGGVGILGQNSSFAIQASGTTLTTHQPLNFGMPISAGGTAAVNCPAGTVSLTTLTVTNGIVTHC